MTKLDKKKLTDDWWILETFLFASGVTQDDWSIAYHQLSYFLRSGQSRSGSR